jgi:hypothetical protein
MVRFFDKWFGTQILPLMFRVCVLEVFKKVRKEEQSYFRSTREAMFGRSLEEVDADAEASRGRLEEALLPLRLALRNSVHISGENPNYADFIVWAAFSRFLLRWERRY